MISKIALSLAFHLTARLPTFARLPASTRLPASDGVLLFSWSLEPLLPFVWGISLIIACLAAWGLNLIALPGNWVATGLLAIYVWLGPDSGRASIGFFVLIAAFLMAAVGEVIELLAAAMGAKRAGASRRSTFFALLGSFVGAIIGAFVGIPIPAIGSIIAAIVFSGAGATVGAMYGEWSDGRPWKESWAVGHAAFWGRTFGMLGKLSAGMAILFLICIALLF